MNLVIVLGNEFVFDLIVYTEDSLNSPFMVSPCCDWKDDLLEPGSDREKSRPSW